MSLPAAPINLTNHFLIAMPAMDDPYFSRALVYVCEHNGWSELTRTEAITAGEIDIYPEYTGNAAFFFNKADDPLWKDAAKAYEEAKKLDYDAVTDFTPISLLAHFQFSVVAGAGVPVKNVKELIALAKKRPGQLNYGSSGVGGFGHISGELFDMMTGTKMAAILSTNC